jgi:hypothetical protein
MADFDPEEFDVDTYKLRPTDCEIKIFLEDEVIDRIPCHQRILSFASVLDTQSSTLHIHLRSEQEVMVFKDMIRFFYSNDLDHVEQTEEALLRLMKMADQYGSSICMLAVMEHPLVGADNF